MEKACPRCKGLGYITSDQRLKFPPENKHIFSEEELLSWNTYKGIKYNPADPILWVCPDCGEQELNFPLVLSVMQKQGKLILLLVIIAGALDMIEHIG